MTYDYLVLPGHGLRSEPGFGYNPASQIVSNMRSNDAYSWTKNAAGSLGYAANGSIR